MTWIEFLQIVCVQEPLSSPILSIWQEKILFYNKWFLVVPIIISTRKSMKLENKILLVLWMVLFFIFAVLSFLEDCSIDCGRPPSINEKYSPPNLIK